MLQAQCSRYDAVQVPLRKQIIYSPRQPADALAAAPAAALLSNTHHRTNWLRLLIRPTSFNPQAESMLQKVALCPLAAEQDRQLLSDRPSAVSPQIQ